MSPWDAFLFKAYFSDSAVCSFCPLKNTPPRFAQKPSGMSKSSRGRATFFDLEGPGSSASIVLVLVRACFAVCDCVVNAYQFRGTAN